MFNSVLPLPGLRVLVIEAEPDSLLLLTLILECHQMQVSTADSIPVALEMMRSVQPNIILLNATLFNLSSAWLQLRQRLDVVSVSENKDAVGTSIPIVAVLDSIREVDEIWLRNQGFQGYIYKPLYKQQVIEVIQQVFLQRPKLNLVKGTARIYHS